MKNYVIINKILDKNSESELKKQLTNRFSKNRTIKENNIEYFSFAERELPGVQDALHTIMDSLSLANDDYIVLFYTRDEEPDMINRLMVFGKSHYFENDIKNLSNTVHENVLIDLLEFDFIRAKN